MVSKFCLSVILFAIAALAEVPYVVIRPNVHMPVVGIGSCCGTYNVSAWIALGFRHIDTSCDYGSEPTIGAAIRASGVPREEFFVTSKINPENYGPDVSGVVQQQVLDPLELSYVDLLLMHHAGRPESSPNRPPCFVNGDPRGTFYACRIETYRSLVALQAKGVARAIGVSNWEIRDLEQLFNATGMWPAVNQIEHHPYWHTDDLIAFCNANNISITAYAPMGAYPRSFMLDNPAIATLARAKGKSVGQVALRWELQKGAGVVIPRSKTPAHMKDNVDIFDFELTAAEVESLNNFPQKKIYATQCQPWC